MIQNAELLEFFEEQYRRGGSRRSIRLGDRLYDDLAIDSLFASELLVALEDRFDLELLHDPRMWMVATVGELFDRARTIDVEKQRTPIAAESAA